MKRFITLAIALMLLLVCGMQIVADDVVVTPNAVCQHEHVYIALPNITTIERSECKTEYYEVTPKTCVDCGANLSTSEYLYTEYHHTFTDWEFDFYQGDGYVIVRHCIVCNFYERDFEEGIYID